MTRVLSGIQPTGEVHLGNYLGALRHWAIEQHEHDAFFCVVDLHAITMPQDPAVLHAKCLEMGAALLAIGLDPTVCTLFLQSHVPEHTELCWLLSCVASMGELRRMTQFKDKTARLGEAGTEAVPVGLFTYPVLQAADILLYDADRVPVGADQKQHIELTRDIAQRFNHRYGETFVLPAPAIPAMGARVMDLQDPSTKMSKSTESDAGRISLFEPQKSIERKFKRAVTDTETEVRFDPEGKPGVSNLLSIMAALSGEAPQQIATRYTQYGPLKTDALELTLHALAPVRERYAQLMGDPGETLRLLGLGADKARETAARTVARAKAAMGFVARDAELRS